MKRRGGCERKLSCVLLKLFCIWVTLSFVNLTKSIFEVQHYLAKITITKLVKGNKLLGKVFKIKDNVL